MDIGEYKGVCFLKSLCVQVNFNCARSLIHFSPCFVLIFWPMRSLSKLTISFDSLC